MRGVWQAVDRDEGGRFPVDGLPGPLDGGQPEAGVVTVTATERNPRPLRVTRRDDDLGCHVRRVVGYVSTCPDCGEKIRPCSTFHLARLALEMHQLHRHGT